MASKEEWENHLVVVLSAKPAEVVQEACQVLDEHGHDLEDELEDELKSGL